MTILASDNFNRANGGLGSNWTTSNSLSAPQIASNLVQTLAVASDSCAYYSAISWPNDHWSEVRVVAATTLNAAVLPAVRDAGSGTNSRYRGFVIGPLGAGTAISIAKTVAGVNSTLASGTATINANDLVRLGVRGTALTLSVNGTSVLTATDSALTSGSAALYIYVDSGATTNAQADDWSGGDFNGSIAWITA